ncbi:helix-turn-helix protein [Stackebrandtia albiflava]|uniref:Helix-turn-helix protein n=1 Tax=Stackebrandtia albiflava TaxID=406432 RepID=A0A562VD73_9ACTN|nr:AraC family transcriptional regulator [Stackebrandtia albiflava]TWJ15829.1 helix-turn-helix protein [Stackebrandtia albiflava]
MHSDHLRDTVPPHLTRLLVEAGELCGLARRRLVGIDGISLLGDDAVRIPTRSMVRVWEELSVALRDVGNGTRPMELWQPGRLGAWDYLMDSADTLAQAFIETDRYFISVSDPRDSIESRRSPDGLTVSFHGPHEALPVVGEFAISLLLTQARSVAHRALRPAGVALPGAAGSRHRYLAAAFGTRDIEFDAPRPSMTLSTADADRPLPHADPALAAIMRDHMRLKLAGAKPVRGWLDRLHAEIDREFAVGAPMLTRVARRLNLSTRTLQRRLSDENTSWSAELERIRAERVERLLTTTSLPVDAIAAQVGYSDTRALRRAVHRWHGQSPVAVRAGH